MADRKRDNEKKEKQVEMEERDKQCTEMPMPNMQNVQKNNHKQHMCPMTQQCPMMYHCPIMNGQLLHQMPMMMMGDHMMPQNKMQMPYMQTPYMQTPYMQTPYMQAPQHMQGVGMKIKDWFDEWDDFSEDSSCDFDSDDFNMPEKYYNKNHKKHHQSQQHPFFWPPYFPCHKR